MVDEPAIQPGPVGDLAKIQASEYADLVEEGEGSVLQGALAGLAICTRILWVRNLHLS